MIKEVDFLWRQCDVCKCNRLAKELTTVVSPLTFVEHGFVRVIKRGTQICPYCIRKYLYKET